MASIFDLPSETLATVFEIGVHAWGTGYLSHVSLVCRDWYLVTISHPHLWGILDIGKVTQGALQRLHNHLIRVKEAPLDITCHPSTNAFQRATSVFVHLKKIRHNFVHLQVPVRFLLETDYNCNNIRKGLKILDLQWGSQSPGTDVSGFFAGVEERSPPKLYSFTAHSLPPSWITPFLSRSITHFRLHKTSNRHLSDFSTASPVTETLQYLSRIPNVITLELDDLNVYRLPAGGIVAMYDSSLRISFNQLQTLEITDVVYRGAILHSIQAPSLLSLTICNSTQSRAGHGDYYPYSNWFFNSTQQTSIPPPPHLTDKSYGSLIPFFLEWSHPQKTPINLHTLELSNVLVAADIPILIRWLHRLPNLVRLIVNVEYDDYSIPAGTLLGGSEPSSVSDAQADSNLYYALSHQIINSSTGKKGWLCPLLTILHLGDVEISAATVMSIARARGRSIPDSEASPSALDHRPGRLHRFTTQLCTCLSEEERDELHSLIKEVGCICLKCEFQSAL